MSRGTTVHTSRTIMFAELDRVMAYGLSSGNYADALADNVTGKKSRSGIVKTARYLRTLYGFDRQDPKFRALAWFWQHGEPADRPLLALVFAIGRDTLLAESIEVVRDVPPGQKVTTEILETSIERNHPNTYSENTRLSLAQNLASSWKQAGFVAGKVKSIRSDRHVSNAAAAFSFLLAYLDGARGDYLWDHPGVRGLCRTTGQLRELALACARKDLMQYQYSGHVTSVAFPALMQKIGIHG